MKPLLPSIPCLLVLSLPEPRPSSRRPTPRAVYSLIRLGLLWLRVLNLILLN